MPNYGIFTNFVFCRFYLKKEKIIAGKKRKRAIVAVSVGAEFWVSQKTSKKMEKELCHDNISFVATQKSKY